MVRCDIPTPKDAEVDIHYNGLQWYLAFKYPSLPLSKLTMHLMQKMHDRRIDGYMISVHVTWILQHVVLS